MRRRRPRQPVRRTIRSGLPVLALVLGLVACSGDLAAPDSRSSEGPTVTEPALTRLSEAYQLIAAVAEAVAPGTDVVPTDGNDPGLPLPCSDPLAGQVYYSISRTFEAAAGRTGADLVQPVRDEFERNGYATTSDPTTSRYARILGGDRSIGFSVLLDRESRRVQINVDTQCGAPEPDGS